MFVHIRRDLVELGHGGFHLQAKSQEQASGRHGTMEACGDLWLQIEA